MHYNNPVIFIYFCHRQPKSETPFLAPNVAKFTCSNIEKFPRLIPPDRYFMQGTKGKRTAVAGRQGDRPQTLKNTRIEKTWNYQYHRIISGCLFIQHKMFAFPVYTVFWFTTVGIISSKSIHDINMYTSSLRQRARLFKLND